MELEKTRTDQSESLRAQTERLQAAHSVEEPSERFAFSGEDGKKILAALDQPFEPNAALTRAMRAAETIEANAQKA